jgi:hypothetical protein
MNCFEHDDPGTKSRLSNPALIGKGLLRIPNLCFSGESLPVIQDRIQAKRCLAFRVLQA